jgi:hypothetical protein
MMRGLLSLFGAAALALSLASCGGDDAPKHPGTPENPLVAEPAEPEAPAAGRSNEAAAAPAEEEQGEEEQGEPGFQALVDRQSSDPRSRFSPCNLVSKPRAGAILGTRVAQPVEAPQGPTCIYRDRGGTMFVSLAVQQGGFGAVRDEIDRLRQVSVGDRRAYCGVHGAPMLYLPLAGGRVLSVSAQCDIAKRFASTAVPRLDG